MDAIERAVRAAANAVLAPLGVSATPLIGFDWQVAASVAGGAALASLLTSVVAPGVGTKGTAALVSLSNDE
jgi:Putative lactococcus lactis phage r1t holin